MQKKKACKKCKMLYEGEKCPNCGSSESIDNWKGRVVILNSESEIAKKLGIQKPGSYAIKTK